MENQIVSARSKLNRSDVPAYGKLAIAIIITGYQFNWVM